MSFTFDLTAMPEPITVKCPGGDFELFHYYLNADERADAVTALGSEGLRGAQDALWPKIYTWKGVNKPDGSPQEMIRKIDEGQEISFLRDVMARVPWVTQIVTVFKQFALNGVSLTRIRPTLEAFIDDKAELDKIAAELTDFFKRHAGRPGGTSTGSCSTATSPSPQG